MISVAIDGPAGSGKSTVSKIIAKKLGFVYLDTGALYRAIAYFIDENNIDFGSENEVKKCLKNIDLKIENSGEEQEILLNGKALSGEIRSSSVTKISSKIAAYKCVRDYLLEFQRSFAKNQNVIMDGRDIGTVVLPNAPVKIFITASPEVRAERRCDQLLKSGEKPNYQEILNSIKKIDYEDSHREIAPLKRADDAVLLDNSDMGLNETIESIINIINERVEKE